MVLPGVLGVILWLVTGNPDWFVLIGVLLLLGVTLDSAIYVWAVKWQPPWMTGVLALVELGLLLVLANILKLDIGIVEGIVFYIGAWLLFVFTKIVLLPIFSLTYVEAAGEFRTTEWSIPASRESLPLLAATDGAQAAPGGLLSEASGAHAIPLQKQPGLSGAAHQIQRRAT
ncbi:MAG: hypothetical protein AABM66_10945 [Actinomycetota bacterium]